MPVTQENKEVAVSSGAGSDVLLFERMSGSEQLGRLFEYRVQLVATRADVKIADVLGKPMAVTVKLPAGGERVFHGVVTRFAGTGWRDSFSRYEATLRPWLWLLTRASNCRIFQNKSVLDIVRDVCEKGGYGGVVNLSTAALTGTYPVLDYCVQYRETDFNFVCRLLEQAGIYYYFEHGASQHTMVLADAYGGHAPAAGYATVKFAGAEGHDIVDEEAVHRWEAAGEIQASSYVLDDFDFEKTQSSVSGGLVARSVMPAGFGQPAYEMYDYPGGYTLAGDGTALARARMESQHGQCEEIAGDTNARGIAAGGLFRLGEHPVASENREVLVTGTQIDVTDTWHASGGSGQGFDFRCAFTAVGKEYSYRPLPAARKPMVRGPQTAIVVGKAGEEIWTDKYGRIKVQFHWDRDGKDDENSSCWVRVQQAWAGKGWGSMFVPRIGMEVVVSFLEGDPDRPLVTGCVYNSDAPPPYALPANQTRSTIKTNSSKGGAGFNEIRFEDKQGDEEIFVQAEKDFNRVVKNNDTLKVGFEKADQGDQTIAIHHDQTLEVGHDQTIAVKNDRKVTVTHDDTETVQNDQKVDVGGKQTITVTGDQIVTGQSKIEITATTSIELTVGGSSIKIEPAKITIKSTEVLVQAQAGVTVEGQAQVAVKSSGMLQLKAGGIASLEGAMVKIN